jgi:hypothetical protein
MVRSVASMTPCVFQSLSVGLCATQNGFEGFDPRNGLGPTLATQAVANQPELARPTQDCENYENYESGEGLALIRKSLQFR